MIEVWVSDWPGIERASPELLGLLYRELHLERGWDFDAALGLISHESGFDPSARNPYPGQTAAGLIQMIDSTAEHYAGVSADRLAQWSAEAQVEPILAFWDTSSRGEEMRGSDYAVAGVGANPRAGDDTLISDDPKVVEVNPSIAEDGEITVGSVRRSWERFVDENANNYVRVEVDENAKHPGAPSRVVPLMLVGVVGVAAVLGLIKRVKI